MYCLVLSLDRLAALFLVAETGKVGSIADIFIESPIVDHLR
jgi:hypothetical protein